MKNFLLGLLGLLILALPQVAGAQNFTGTNAYAAKFLCGSASGAESVVFGHYDTTINVLATKSNQPIAYRASATKNEIGVINGSVSVYSARSNLDRDQALGIVCGDIKTGLFGTSADGFIEGFVIVYSNGPLLVTDVLTGESGPGLSTMQIYQVNERVVTGVTVKPGH